LVIELGFGTRARALQIAQRSGMSGQLTLSISTFININIKTKRRKKEYGLGLNKKKMEKSHGCNPFNR
jgi:hypothetical protein